MRPKNLRQKLNILKKNQGIKKSIFETETQGTNFLYHVKGNITRALYFRVTESIQATYRSLGNRDLLPGNKTPERI